MATFDLIEEPAFDLQPDAPTFDLQPEDQPLTLAPMTEAAARRLQLQEEAEIQVPPAVGLYEAPYAFEVSEAPLVNVDPGWVAAFTGPIAPYVSRETLRRYEKDVAAGLSSTTSPKSLALLPLFMAPVIGQAAALALGTEQVSGGAGRLTAARTPEEKAAASAEITLGFATAAPALAHAPLTKAAVAEVRVAKVAEPEGEISGAVARAPPEPPPIPSPLPEAPKPAEVPLPTPKALPEPLSEISPRPPAGAPPSGPPQLPVPPVPPVAALPDPGAILEATKRQDVLAGRDLWTSPEFEFRRIPEARQIATSIVEGELHYRAQAGRDNQVFDAMKAKLTREQRVKVTEALRERQLYTAAGQPVSPKLEALSPVEREVATGIRGYFDSAKGAIIDAKKADLIDALPGARQAALRAILEGESPDVAFRDNRLRGAGRQAVQDALDELRSLDNWGIPDYVTNIERGQYTLLDPSGTIVAKAETRAAAVARGLKWLQDNPGIDTLTLTDEFMPGVEFPTKLSRGQYFRMVGRMSDALQTDAATIQTMLRANGAIVAVKPTNKYAGALQKRRWVLKGEEDIFDVLPTYAYTVRKKLSLDPVFKEARALMDKLPPNAKVQVQALLDDVRGRYTLPDQIADGVLSFAGRYAPFIDAKPFAMSRGLSNAREIMTSLKLGYRPVTALINRASGLQHTWAKVGTHYWLEGRKFMKSPEWNALWEANRDYIGAATEAFIEGVKGGEAKLWEPLYMFQYAERANRPEAFAAFYRYAQDRLALSPEESAAYARNQTRLTQFTYDMASLPRMMRNPVGRTMLQFKPYLVKELEFLATLDKAQHARYWTGFLALGGPRAFVYMLRSLPILGAVGLLSGLEAWLNREAPAVSRGLGAAAGVDVTAAVTPQLPSRPEDWFGPIVADLYRLHRDVLAPSLRGERRDFSDVGDWLSRLSPQALYWSRLIESAQTEGGWINDERGRPVYQPDAADKIKMVLGAKPLDQSVQEVETRYLREVDAIVRANRMRLIDDLLDAEDRKDGDAVKRLSKQAAEYGIDADAVRRAGKMRELLPEERLRRSLLKSTREQMKE